MSWIMNLLGGKTPRLKQNGPASLIIDARDDAERAIEHRAQTPLDAPIERIAETLTTLSLTVEAMCSKPSTERLLRQLEGYRGNSGGISQQELEMRIAKNRAELAQAEEAIRVLIPALEACSLSVSTPDDGNHHLSHLGRQLNEKGGLELMKLVAYRCQALGARLIYIESAWDGIGGWKC